MRNSILRKYIILQDDNKKYLYGKVYNDNRFPNGHLIFTTKIVNLDENNNLAVTENNTEYKLEQLLTKEEFIKMIQEDYIDSSYVKFLLSPLKNFN